MRKILALCACLCATAAFAIPAKRVRRMITLADGTQKEVMLCGDENVHYFLDAAGKAYTEREDGCFMLADKQALDARWGERLAKRNQLRLERAEKRGIGVPSTTLRQGMFRAWGDVQNPISGSKRGLVILVSFSDKAINSKHTQAYFDDYFNKEGFSQDGMQGSVHDYFKECSYGKFDLTFDVVGPVKVSNTMSYYGSNDSYGNDKYVGVMVAEACKLADAQGVDFSKYDWDRDGEVDQVYIIYAGYGENAGASTSTIWPHEYDLYSANYFGDGPGPQKFDGVTVNTYAVSSELAGTSGTRANGIGTACHEFSHCMCIPDMYDTSEGAANFGMDMWDLMNTGSYRGMNGYGDLKCLSDGECPTPYTAYERMYCGWLTPTELTNPCVIQDMKPLATHPEAYIIYNQKNRNEYYLLENHQKVGFDKSAPGTGMLVVHVDFDKDDWINNSVNSKAYHQRMTIIPADNQFMTGSSYGDKYATDKDLAGDPWPGTSRSTALTNTSTPASTLYSANIDGRKFLSKPIEQISENTQTGTISFLFDGGVNIDAPVALQASDIRADGFTANWKAVSGAEEYEVQLTARTINDVKPEDAMLLSEDFAKFSNGLSMDGTQDISKDLDKYTALPGWTGSKLYTSSKDRVKLGSSLGAGSLTTPLLHSSEDVVTIRISTHNYSADQGYLDVKINEQIVGMANLSASVQDFVFTASVTGDFKVTIASTKRAYLYDIYVYDGTYDIEELKPAKVMAKVAENKSYKTKDTKYVFTSLDATKQYSYKVRAYEKSVPGPWSEAISVDLQTGILQIVDTEEDRLNDNVKIYDLSGRRLSRIPSHGIYIVNGKKIVRQ